MKRKKKSCFWNPHDIDTQEIKKKKKNNETLTRKMYQKDITNQTPESVFKSSIVLKIVFGKKYSKKWMAE